MYATMTRTTKFQFDAVSRSTSRVHVLQSKRCYGNSSDAQPGNLKKSLDARQTFGFLYLDRSFL